MTPITVSGVSVRTRNTIEPDTFVYGAQRPGGTMPTDQNTGVPSEYQAAATANVIPGDLTVVFGGTPGNPRVLPPCTVNGRVFMNASYVRLSPSYVNGSATPYGSPDTALVVIKEGAVGIELVQCTLDGAKASPYLNGIRGADVTTIRCRIKNVVDGIDYFRQTDKTSPLNCYDYGSFIDQLTYISPDNVHTDKRTHNDGVAISTAGGVWMLGTRIDARVSTTLGSGYDGLPAPEAANPYAPSVTGQGIAILQNVSIAQHPIVLDGLWLAYGSQCVTWIKGAAGTNSALHEIKNCLIARNSNPLITKGGITARRPFLIDSSIPVMNIPTVENLAGVNDTDITSGGSNNRWADDLSFAPFTRMVNAG